MVENKKRITKMLQPLLDWSLPPFFLGKYVIARMQKTFLTTQVLAEGGERTQVGSVTV